MATVTEGQRVRLISCSDPHTQLKCGDEGTVRMVDDMGTVHVNWDSGSSLGLISGDDHFEIIHDDEQFRFKGVGDRVANLGSHSGFIARLGEEASLSSEEIQFIEGWLVDAMNPVAIELIKAAPGPATLGFIKAAFALGFFAGRATVGD